ncbi:hypothetical protein ACI68E_002560 [Malassezia pachydermatis]|uniref:Pentatricopeptide repeat-containing protein n=1 Tax=Malassezia pachydermatis TaxID=77020 RepID=A0A0M8MVW2_9BASI|nr:hypothetical protein Malapachy_0651 [Malassezia pachydermatis]KOS14631.1 hypothetical protein Malapachy_0651 [Malassezia pachydermatis]
MFRRESAMRRELAELERDVHLSEKRAQSEALTRDLPPLDEATLEAMYLELSTTPAPRPQIEAPPKPPSVTQLADKIAAVLTSHDLETPTGVPTVPSTSIDTPLDAPSRHARRASLLKALESVPSTSLPLAPLEWAAIAAESAHDRDVAHIQHVLQLAAYQQVDCVPLFHSVMDVYATAGEWETVLQLSAKMEEYQVAPTSEIKHTIVKAYANANHLMGAVQYLTHWEASEPAPQSSYALVLDHLLKQPTRDVQPLAWSLFYHMRFAAHPVPDTSTYAMMIRACAAGIPQPTSYWQRRKRPFQADAERALDLFREMTLHHRIRPTKDVYDSLILTCARRKDHYQDAIRLLCELMDGSPDHAAPLSPDVYTYNAVLQGSARQGDLRTARWVLADMVHQSMNGVLHRAPNEETMANVFWTYAVFQPPQRRSDLRTAPAATSTTQADDEAVEMVAASPEADVTSSDAPSFTHAMPSTASDVLAEARAFMARILADQGAPSTATHPLATVSVTPRLLNAFLSVLMHHLTPRTRLRTMADTVWGEDGVFAQAHIQPNGHTLAMILGECTTHADRAYADELATSVWTQWTALENEGRREDGVDTKTISQMWARMIRQHAKAFRVEEALALLRAFYKRYPPHNKAMATDVAPVDTSAPTSANAMDWMPVPPPPSMLKALQALPLGPVRPGSYVSFAPMRPKLLFADLELLHHRCVALRHVRGLNLITRIDREYRREW